MIPLPLELFFAVYFSPLSGFPIPPNQDALSRSLAIQPSAKSFAVPAASFIE
jgi:hypothetical protein